MYILTFLVLFISVVSGINAYVTYNLYYENELSNTVSCSKTLQKWNYSNISQMWPYVGAASFANNINCGTCVNLISNKASIYLTVIDQCSNIKKTQFDISKLIFIELFEDKGIYDGHGYVNWSFVEPFNCKGNLRY